MPKLTKLERFQIAATLLSGSEAMRNAAPKDKITRLLILAQELEERENERVDVTKQVSILDIL